MTVDKACRDCHFISQADVCPQCKSTNLSKDIIGFVVIVDAKKSRIAQKMGIDAPGKYALKVR
ncbi:MAG TPA: transcription elongation factor subunit Spt4 [Candidatus Thermoplasmatota archaeon]|nr:transcription elongation factor subunit Spt4 [Candidatus Thermoplasmatota archaeon]